MMMFEQEERLYVHFNHSGCTFSIWTHNVQHFGKPKAPKNIKPDSKNEACYKNCPVGVNTLSQIMKHLSKEANPSNVYTNHCLRATVASALYTARVEREDIKIGDRPLNIKNKVTWPGYFNSDRHKNEINYLRHCLNIVKKTLNLLQ